MQDESETALGNLIRQRRRDLGLSLNHLAAATGLHKSFLSRLEAGIVRQPAGDSLRRIAAALKLPETALYGLLDRRAATSCPPCSRTCAPSTTCPTPSSPTSRLT